MQCPTPQILQHLLDDTVLADQRAEIETHLESCPICQQQLEKLAAGGVTWDKTAQNLGEKPASGETALTEALSKLNDTPTSALLTQAESMPRPIDVDLSFLQPSEKPNSLGKC